MTSPTERPSPHRRMEALAVLLCAVLASLVAFGPAVDGDFVYDDTRQIVENHLVRSPNRLAGALLEDVWAFKGDREEPWSAYWRPTFVLWVAAGAGVLGVAHPTPWHLANLALHAAVCALLWTLLRRLGWRRELAWVAALAFAVHPAHVESVAWISGVPDLLAAFFALACLLTLLAAAPSASVPAPAAAWALGLAALLAKESAIGLPVLAGLALWLAQPSDREAAARRRVSWQLGLAPGVAIAGLVLGARVAVLGNLTPEVPWPLTVSELLLNAPRVLVFYLRQALLPLEIAPAYPLRALRLADVALADVALPLAVLAAAAGGAWLLARRTPVVTFTAATFVVTLAPALRIDAFMPEQIVHDRYLYLAVIGPICAVVAALDWAGGRLPRLRPTVPAVVAATALVLLTAGARQASRCWTSEVALWRAAVANDPGSASSRAQLAEALLAAGRREEALAEAERALQIAPATTALLVRSEINVETGRTGEAIADLERILERLPNHAAAWERLAAARQRAGDLAGAERTLREARQRVPWRECSMTSNLAVVLVLSGRRDDARRELLAVVDADEHTPPCHLVPFWLARLELDRGERRVARGLLDEFLRRSAADRDPVSLRRRQEAARLLEGLQPTVAPATPAAAPASGAPGPPAAPPR